MVLCASYCTCVELTSSFRVTIVRADGSRFDADRTSFSWASCYCIKNVTVQLQAIVYLLLNSISQSCELFLQEEILKATLLLDFVDGLDKFAIELVTFLLYLRKPLF